MNDFLITIDGQSSEDLTSEVLIYILTHKEYSAYQRLFFNYILGQSENLDTDELEFEISTQVKFPKFGIPDILIKNNNDVYIIENKFYAPYSGENQISRYVKILNKSFTNCQKRPIYFLTIKCRLDYYKSLINEDLKKSRVNTKNIEIKYLLWEELLHILKSNDFIIQNLTNYIKKNYLTNITFSKSEINMLQNKAIPQAIQKLFDLIYRMRDTVYSRNYKTGRMGQSNQFLGFNIKLKSVDVWFGYFFPVWKSPIDENICTPIYAQIRNEWIKVDNFDNSSESKLKEIGFQKHPDYEWLKPYKVELIDDIDLLSNQLVNDLIKLENIAYLNKSKN